MTPITAVAAGDGPDKPLTDLEADILYPAVQQLQELDGEVHRTLYHARNMLPPHVYRRLLLETGRTDVAASGGRDRLAERDRYTAVVAAARRVLETHRRSTAGADRATQASVSGLRMVTLDRLAAALESLDGA